MEHQLPEPDLRLLQDQHAARRRGNWNTTRLNFTDGGYTYAWGNGTIPGQKLLPVTSGVGGGVGIVTVTTPINISDPAFATPGYGNYNITGSVSPRRRRFVTGW